jgi:NCAIR mutase (PurE)-related protein
MQLAGVIADSLDIIIAGFITSAVVGWLSIALLMRIIQTHTFMPFIIYRLVAGTFFLLYFARAGHGATIERLTLMDEARLREMLQSLESGALTVDDALDRLRRLPYEDMGFASVDHHRALRTGFPEVILGHGKTPEQIAAIAERLAAGADRLLVTRADLNAYRAIRERLPDAVYHAVARAITLECQPTEKRPGVVVCCAGTSDLPVAEEARVTAELMGSVVDTMYDVGVAGIHRLLDKSERLQAANAVVVVAGMEGALPSVGACTALVIAVPTSIG